MLAKSPLRVLKWGNYIKNIYPYSGSVGQSNADQIDKATVRAERTVLGLLSSFTITYSFWLVGFYMQVHATNKGECLLLIITFCSTVPKTIVRLRVRSKTLKDFSES